MDQVLAEIRRHNELMMEQNLILQEQTRVARRGLWPWWFGLLSLFTVGWLAEIAGQINQGMADIKRALDALPIS